MWKTYSENCKTLIKKTEDDSRTWNDPLEKGMVTHSSILAWRTPWTEEPGGLHSPWSGKESDMTEQLSLTHSCSWTGGINIVKMAILPKAIYRLNAIPIKLSMIQKNYLFFTELEQVILNLYGTIKDPELSKKSWRKNKAGGISLQGFRQHCKATDTDTDRHESMEQIENREINPHTCGWLVFDTGGKNIQCEKQSPQQVVLGKLDSHM